MTEKRPKNGETSSVMGALPNSRPHRRSEKRKTAAPKAAGARPAGPKAAAPKTAAPKAVAPKAAAAARPKAAPAAGPKAPAAEPKPAGGPKRSAAGVKAAGSRPLRQPPQPRGLPQQPKTSRPKVAEPAERPAPPRRELLATAVQAAAELTEMGLSAGARALREAVSRLPRP